jgi:hypothetical protein
VLRSVVTKSPPEDRVCIPPLTNIGSVTRGWCSLLEPLLIHHKQRVLSLTVECERIPHTRSVNWGLSRLRSSQCSLINWKEGASQKPITQSLQGPPVAASTRASPHCLLSSCPTLQAHKGQTPLNSFSSCGCHWICICLSLAGPARCQLLRAALAAGCSPPGPGPLEATAEGRGIWWHWSCSGL